MQHCVNVIKLRQMLTSLCSLQTVVMVTICSPRDTMLVRVLAVIVCPSVRLSHASIVPKWLNVGSCKQRHVIAQGLLFSDANSRWWATPFPLKLVLKVTHTHFEHKDFDQHPLNYESWQKKFS